MGAKEFKIQVPEGYEIDKWNSTFDCVKFKPIKKKLTYEDVVKYLFSECYTYCLDYKSNIIERFRGVPYNDLPNGLNCASKKQASKVLAINKLLNVAKYLNGEWKPNWKDADEKKYFIYICPRDCYTSVKSATVHMSDIVYFKSEELARQTIEILGEETIKTALSTDW